MESKISQRELKNYFKERGYNCLKPYRVVNNTDTVFLTAGIQPILSNFRNLSIDDTHKIFLAQPVIRTQFVDSICEGSSIAFINATTAGFNILEEEHNKLVEDWLNLFFELGMSKKSVSKRSKDYERTWGDLLVSGKKTFYYYDGLELGDTTYFTKVTKDGKNIGIDTMSDLGFGLERLRWCISGKSYYDLYSDSREISPQIKAYLQALALLTVNDVVPSNKNSGYRVRMFSKRLVNLLEGRLLSNEEKKYFLECIKYWQEWQEVNKEVDILTFEKEYLRNCNRYIIDKLTQEGYKNLSGININVGREEMMQKLISSGVDIKRVRKL